ncbi:hypothetical protein DPMN_176566 [Dreissena polymorpha]|uniref:Uncharacterized protein n=1 Tax=Dreissena polymorpha TaxID=45954 RepID=A0A9D4E9C1_DREPO|nr:hypothetical protein DPMN_176566 [Dreissena polymorpha]
MHVRLPDFAEELLFRQLSLVILIPNSSSCWSKLTFVWHRFRQVPSSTSVACSDRDVLGLAPQERDQHI